MKTATSFILMAIVFAHATCMADKITLRSGRVLNGAVVSETPTEISFRTSMGTLRLSRADVAATSRDDSTAEEVDGDAALAARNYELAKGKFRAALDSVPKNGPAVARLQGKLQQIEKSLQQARSSAEVAKVQQAQQLLASRQYDAAQEILDQTIPQMPPTDEATTAARRLLAEVHYAKSKLARDSVNSIRVEQELRAAVAAYEPYGKAHLELGEILLRSATDDRAAIEQIRKGLHYGESELGEEEKIRYNYILGRKLFELAEFEARVAGRDREAAKRATQDYENAASSFAECLKTQNTYPAYSDALDRAVEAYIKMGEQNVMSDTRKTITSLKEALRLNSKNKQAHFLLGKMYRDAGNTDEAIQEFKTVIELDPKFPLSHYNLAQAYMDKRDFDSAQKQLDDEIQNNPRNYDAMTDRAEVNILLASYDKASEDLAQAKLIEPNRWRAYLLTSQLAFAQEKYDEAKQNLENVLRIKPDAIEAHIQMGKILKAEKSFEGAQLWLQNVVQHLSGLRNLSFKYRNLMAEAQVALGDIDMAQENFNTAGNRYMQALEFVPDFGPALNRLGDVKKRQGANLPDPAKQKEFFLAAVDSYNKAIKSEPKNPDFYLSLGIIYQKNLKDAQKAVINYTKYLDLNGRDRLNVSSWIAECGGTPPSDVGTTATEAKGAKEASAAKATPQPTPTPAPVAKDAATSAPAAKDKATTATTDQATTSTKAQDKETTS
jgi:tetratricopeptide (TPR) repeat protein